MNDGLILTKLIISLFLIVYCVASMAFTTGLLFYHTNLVLNNSTTKEELKHFHENPFGNPYKRNTKRNCKTVLCPMVNKKSILDILKSEDNKRISNVSKGESEINIPPIRKITSEEFKENIQQEEEQKQETDKTNECLESKGNEEKPKEFIKRSNKVIHYSKISSSIHSKEDRINNESNSNSNNSINDDDPNKEDPQETTELQNEKGSLIKDSMQINNTLEKEYSVKGLFRKTSSFKEDEEKEFSSSNKDTSSLKINQINNSFEEKKKEEIKTEKGFDLTKKEPSEIPSNYSNCDENLSLHYFNKVIPSFRAKVNKTQFEMKDELELTPITPHISNRSEIIDMNKNNQTIKEENKPKKEEIKTFKRMKTKNETEKRSIKNLKIKK
ncbi:MAG: hypothetical protein MJ252_02445 [archaeon]|nr:hypothetical protein [archaeon]